MNCIGQTTFPSQSLKIGLDALNFYYKEPGVMDEKGWIPGESITATKYNAQNLMAEFSGSIYYGITEYNGAYSDGTPLTADSDNLYLNLKAVIGQGVMMNDIGLTPYIGIGMRYWHNDIKASGGYNRYITQYYLPLGVHITSGSSSWRTGGTLEGSVLLGGKVRTQLSDVSPLYGDADNNQKFGYGGSLRLSAFVENHQGNYTLGIEPYVEYWHFANSQPDHVNYGNLYSIHVLEPNNDFYLSGISLYVKF